MQTRHCKNYHLFKKLGIEICTNTQIGKDVSFQKLQNDYHEVFIGVGLAKIDFYMKAKNIRGVRGAVEIIEEIKLKQAVLSDVKHVIIIGGGNTALDIAQTFRFLEIFQVLAYRKSKNENEWLQTCMNWSQFLL